MGWLLSTSAETGSRAEGEEVQTSSRPTASEEESAYVVRDPQEKRRPRMYGGISCILEPAAEPNYWPKAPRLCVRRLEITREEMEFLKSR